MVSVGDKLLFPKEADFFESQSFYADLRRRNTHRTTPAPVNCVVVATARNCASTSNVFCRDIDNNERGEGKPFQLRKSGNRSFWTNEEVTNEGLKFGCQLTYYQSLLRRGCKLGEQDEKQFIFEKKTDKEQGVDGILMDLQGDENVYGGLEEAHEYYNQKDMATLIKTLVSSAETFLELYKTHEYLKPKKLCEELLCLEDLFCVCNELFEWGFGCFDPKNVHRVQQIFKCIVNPYLIFLKNDLQYLNQKDVLEIHLGFKNLFRAYGKLLKKALECFNQKDVVELQLGFTYLLSAYGELFKKTFECCNQKDVNKILLDLQGDEIVYLGLEEAHEYYNQKDVDKTPPDFQDDESVYGGLREAHEYHYPKFPRLQAHLACTSIFFIGIKAGTINNEKVTLETMSGECLDMPLNCRESLVLSTGPVHLQLKRPWDVADDAVRGVAVVKYEAGEATCEGLILRYKPLVISRDEEPVEMKNAFGEVIPVRGRRKVLFDTGNEVGTGISRELLLKLNLQSDPSKKKKVKLIEESCEFETADIELIVRGHHFSVNGLVDAVNEDTNLLVGMDVIQQLYDKGYTIGE